MFSINQDDFIGIQEGVCWLASAVNMAFNNILKRNISEDDIKSISEYCLYKHKAPMSKTGNQIKAGTDRIQGRMNNTSKIIKLKRGSKIANIYLDKGMVIGCLINSSSKFKQQFKQGKIEGDFTKEKSSGHWICIFRKEGKDYILNSWYGDKRDVCELGNTIGLFKNDDLTLLT